MPWHLAVIAVVRGLHYPFGVLRRNRRSPAHSVAVCVCTARRAHRVYRRTRCTRASWPVTVTHVRTRISPQRCARLPAPSFSFVARCAYRVSVASAIAPPSRFAGGSVGGVDCEIGVWWDCFTHSSHFLQTDDAYELDIRRLEWSDYTPCIWGCRSGTARCMGRGIRGSSPTTGEGDRCWGGKGVQAKAPGRRDVMATAVPFLGLRRGA